MNFTLRQLEYFRALAQLRNFSHAAARCNVSQPALSVQIKALESALGRDLFERRSGGLRITRFGSEMLRHAEQVLGAAQTMAQGARWQDGLGGVLNIGLIPTVAPYLLPKALPLIAAQAGALDLRIREAQTKVLLEDIDAGRLDAAILALPVAGRYESIALFDDSFLLAGAAHRISQLGAGREALRPRNIDPDQLLLLDEGHCLADQALDVCGLDRARMRIDLGASSLATLCGMVAQGHGYTFLPELALASELNGSPDLAVLRFAAPQPSRRIGLLRRAQQGESRWFHDLAALVTEAAADLLGHAQRLCPPCTAA